ncbi:MAG: hypothetical protein AAGI11_01860 [Pseudomonadota bacterium]
MTSPALPTLLCLAIFCLPTTVHAHLPELYGREYRRVDPLAEIIPNRALDAGPSTLPSEEEKAIAALLDAAESRGGAYDQGQADPLINLAQLRLARDDASGAAEAYRQAIHLVRVNEGLYSRGQLPLLRALMALYREAGNLPALGDAAGYYFRVLNPAAQDLSGENLVRSLEYLRWEREIYASRRDGEQLPHLLRAYRANEALLSQAAGESDANAYLELVFSQMRNLYLILGEKPLEMKADTRTPTETALNGIQRTGQSTGVKLLESALAWLDDTTSVTQARVYLERGDWYQWNGQSRRAGAAYAEVVALLSKAGEEALLADWLGEAIEIPDERDLWPLLTEESRRPPVVVEARYRVTASGDVRSVSVTTAREEDEWQANRVRRMLLDTHFRPRIGPLGPEPTPEVTRYYRLLNLR